MRTPVVIGLFISGSGLNRNAKLLFYSVFFALWIAGLTTGLTARACRNPSYHGEKKLTYCNISLSVGSILPREAPKRSIVYVERGIALSDLGRSEEAVADFRHALDDVAGARETYLQRIVQRIENEKPGSMARMNFAAAMASRN